jgi:hypothetical protein
MAAVTAFFYALDDDGVFASHVFVPPNDPFRTGKRSCAALASHLLMATMPETLLSKR